MPRIRDSEEVADIKYRRKHRNGSATSRRTLSRLLDKLNGAIDRYSTRIKLVADLSIPSMYVFALELDPPAGIPPIDGNSDPKVIGYVRELKYGTEFHPIIRRVISEEGFSGYWQDEEHFTVTKNL